MNVQLSKVLLPLQHIYGGLSSSKKHPGENNPTEKLHVVCRSDDVHVEMSHTVYWPVEPSHNIANLPSPLLQDLHPNLLHLPHQRNVLATEGPDVDNVFLNQTRLGLHFICSLKNTAVSTLTFGITR